MALFRRKRALSASNVSPTWVTDGLWLQWEPPHNVVAGESSYFSTLSTLCGPARPGGYCRGTEVVLTREPSNEYDPNAIMAEVRGHLVGYLRRPIAAQLSPVLDDARCRRFTVCGVVRGGWPSKPNFGVHLWLGRRTAPGPEIALDTDEWVVSAWPPEEPEWTA